MNLILKLLGRRINIIRNRIRYIDYVKGLGILLVILGHIGYGSDYIYIFHMPLFFFISGLLLSNLETKDAIQFLSSKIKGILVPYLVFSIISFIWWAMIERHLRDQSIPVMKALLNIFIPYVGASFIYNVVLWFLVAILFSYFFVFFLVKITNNHGFIMGLTSIFVFLLISQINEPKIFELSIAFSGGQLCMTAGYIIRKYKIGDLKELENTKNIYLLIGFLSGLFGIWIAHYFNHDAVNMMNNSYGNLLLFILGAAAGIVLIFSLALILNRINLPVLSFLGINSLVIMAVHDPIKRIVIVVIAKLLRQENEVVRHEMFPALLILILVTIVSSVAAIIINKYFPFFLGKGKKRKLIN
ncbi:acyltransferase family protein [Enterococcus sp. 22-H-5-01]|uniref:acyltransferase family protein n=1 Tax=Enterococcus sp. 22-H-5-01 TaxID=3418555 RepID=UPI003D017B21